MQQVKITYKLNDSNRSITLNTFNTKGSLGLNTKESVREAIINTFPFQFISEFYGQRYSNDLKVLQEYMLGIQKEYTPIHLHDVRMEIQTDEPFELRTSNKIVKQGSTTFETIINVMKEIKEHFESADKPLPIAKAKVKK
jgi:hypothetical protein